MTALVDRLRHDLLAARRAGDRLATAALRSALSRLDNAEAVPVGEEPPADPGVAGESPVAGSRAGAGAAEAPRRRLTEDEQRALLRAEVVELLDAVAVYEDAEPGRAAAARHGAQVLERVLAETPGAG